jgi:hypothetical protein
MSEPERDPRTRRARRGAIATIAVTTTLLLLVPQEGLARPKRLASGLMSVGNHGEWPSVIDVWVPNIEWRDVQPGPSRFRFGFIDDMIRRAKASGDVLRLRILAGRYAPDWVRRRFGTVGVYDPVDAITARVPRWWVRGYMRQFRRLQARLAARYDGLDVIRSVTVSGAMTVWAEPFIRGTSSSVTRRNLLAAGYSPRKDRRAIFRSIDAQRPWKRTRQILAFNPWQFVRGDGTVGSSTRFTNRAMDRFRGIFGRRAILQNNSIKASWIGNMPAGYAEMYVHMRALGHPISFQTAQTFRVGDLGTVLAWSVAQGAHGVEIHRGAGRQLTVEEARYFDRLLQARA